MNEYCVNKFFYTKTPSPRLSDNASRTNIVISNLIARKRRMDKK